MITDHAWADTGPVTGEPGDPEYGSVRVCQFHDPDTGSFMYRVEKESSAPADEAEVIAMHVNAAYAKRLLSFIQSQEGGEMGAKGCMLLIRGGATQASDSAVTALSRDTRAGFPDPRRPTKHNPEGSPDWRQERPDLDLQQPLQGCDIAPEGPIPMPKEEAITGGQEEDPETQIGLF